MRDEINIDAPDNRGNVSGKNTGTMDSGTEHVELSNESTLNYFTTMCAVSFDRTLMFSAEGTKALMYINGGAAVALLAFCGSYIGEIDWMSLLSLVCFSIGALVCILIFYTQYFAQANFTEFENRKGNKLEKIAIVLASIAMGCFILGIIFSTISIKNLHNKKIIRECRTTGGLK